jgi:NDP-sugar pyrophosphorylase family protein
MQIVVPMSGRGERYRRRGHRAIKPLIEVDGRPMIEHVMEMFPGEADVVFICAKDHLEETPLAGVLARLAPAARVVGIEPHKRGPVHAALEAAGAIRDDSPVLLSYCDFSVAWDWAAFKAEVARTACDGAIIAYRGFHPHSLGPTLYAYMRESGGRMLEIREKAAFTGDRMNEYASAGSYYFKSGALLKRAFRRAVEVGLQTNGEYYASMPYNLLVADGLDVRIHEVERFLQWGTPEDLAEYQAWSDYFRKSAGWRPRRAPRGALVVPMAGAGERFRREGYAVAKPLIPVAGVPMIERALATLPQPERTVLVCRGDTAGAMRSHARPGTSVIELASLTAGQACTCLTAEEDVDPEAPLLIAPCDASVVYDEAALAPLIDPGGADAVVFTFKDHAHANRNPEQYGWVRAGADGRVSGISCKVPISADPSADPGIIGTFWFRRARAFFDAVRSQMEKGRRRNGEFYVDDTLTEFLEAGADVRHFDVRHYIGLGTPDDVRTFEYWHRHFGGGSR